MTLALKTAAARQRPAQLKSHPGHLRKRRTFFDGWCAYVDDNAGVPVRSERFVDGAGMAGIFVAFVVAADAILPFAPQFPWLSF